MKYIAGICIVILFGIVGSYALDHVGTKPATENKKASTETYLEAGEGRDFLTDCVRSILHTGIVSCEGLVAGSPTEKKIKEAIAEHGLGIKKSDAGSPFIFEKSFFNDETEKNEEKNIACSEKQTGSYGLNHYEIGNCYVLENGEPKETQNSDAWLLYNAISKAYQEKDSFDKTMSEMKATLSNVK